MPLGGSYDFVGRNWGLLDVFFRGGEKKKVVARAEARTRQLLIRRPPSLMDEGLVGKDENWLRKRKGRRRAGQGRRLRGFLFTGASRRKDPGGKGFNPEEKTAQARIRVGADFDFIRGISPTTKERGGV